MSNDIKTVYKDQSGNDHDTRAQAKKANRLIMAADDADAKMDNKPLLLASRAMLSGDLEEAESLSVIEYARAVVAIYGMKDKPAPKGETEGSQ